MSKTQYGSAVERLAKERKTLLDKRFTSFKSDKKIKIPDEEFRLELEHLYAKDGLETYRYKGQVICTIRLIVIDGDYTWQLK